MATAGRTAAEQAHIDAELGALRFHWGSAYKIEFSDEDGWHAKRLDGRGGWLTGADPEALYKAITDDYTLKPVARSYAPPDE